MVISSSVFLPSPFLPGAEENHTPGRFWRRSIPAINNRFPPEVGGGQKKATVLLNEAVEEKLTRDNKQDRTTERKAIRSI